MYSFIYPFISTFLRLVMDNKFRENYSYLWLVKFSILRIFQLQQLPLSDVNRINVVTSEFCIGIEEILIRLFYHEYIKDLPGRRPESFMFLVSLVYATLLCKPATQMETAAGTLAIRAPDIVYTKQNVLEHAVFLLKPLVLRSERVKPVFKNVQKHLYDPKHVLLCIIFLHARKLHGSWSSNLGF